MPAIRPGEAADLEQIAAIQNASPEAAQWPPADYLKYGLLVAIVENRVAAFLATRSLIEGEYEILNLAVASEFRRQGVARALWKAFAASPHASIYLEVRESNRAARNFYLSLGFQEVGTRPAYYPSPPETAIVMKFHSC